MLYRQYKIWGRCRLCFCYGLCCYRLQLCITLWRISDFRKMAFNIFIELLYVAIPGQLQCLKGSQKTANEIECKKHWQDDQIQPMFFVKNILKSFVDIYGKRCILILARVLIAHMRKTGGIYATHLSKTTGHAAADRSAGGEAVYRGGVFQYILFQSCKNAGYKHRKYYILF